MYSRYFSLLIILVLPLSALAHDVLGDLTVKGDSLKADSIFATTGGTPYVAGHDTIGTVLDTTYADDTAWEQYIQDHQTLGADGQDADSLMGGAIDTVSLGDNYTLHYDLATGNWDVGVDETGAGGADYADSLRTSDDIFDADLW